MILRKFAVLFALLLLAGLVQAEQALLWKVERNGEVSHLFGTIHLPDPRVTELPGPVEQAFSDAGTVVVEVPMDQAGMMEMAMQMLLPDGVELADRLPEGLYRETLAAAAELGYPELAIKRMEPWAVMLSLSVPPSTEPVLDQILYARAGQAGKRVVGLETVGEQIAVFSELTGEEQVALLRHAVEQSESLGEEMERMTAAYLARDIGALAREHRTSLESLPEAVAEKFNRRLLTERDARMAERLGPILEEGGAFVAVGALHLPGLIRQLQNAGDSVSAVY